MVPKEIEVPETVPTTAHPEYPEAAQSPCDSKANITLLLLESKVPETVATRSSAVPEPKLILVPETVLTLTIRL